MSDHAERLLRRIEAIDTAAADNRARAQTYALMAAELRSVTGTVTSPDGAVTVVAGPGGEVTQITFSDRIRTIEPSALAASVMHALAAARAAAARQQADVVRRGLGDSELLDRVLDSDERFFGDQRPVDPGPAPVASPPRRRSPRRGDSAADDEFFEEFDVFGGGPGR